MQKKKKHTTMQARGGGRGRGSSPDHDRDSASVDQREESTSVGEWIVPSVRAIQEALVEIGDKPSEFAGSREWVGCFEACLVLDHLFSVSLLQHSTVLSSYLLISPCVMYVQCTM